MFIFFFSSRRRHTRWNCDWSSDVCSSDLTIPTRSEETFEVVEFEPDRRLVIRGQIGPFSGDIAYLLEGAANATVLTNTCDLRAHGPLSAMAPLATRRVQSAVAANLDVLKQILERP